MSKRKKIYKIREIATGEYISLGYRPRKTWVTFPGAAIQMNPGITEATHIVDVFELYQVQSVTIKNEKI